MGAKRRERNVRSETAGAKQWERNGGSETAGAKRPVPQSSHIIRRVRG